MVRDENQSLLAPMKPPRICYFVATWYCLALLIQVSHLTRPAKAYREAGEPIPVLWTTLPLIALAFVAWQTLGLVRLRRFHRWFAIVFFSSWSATLLWNANIVLRQPTAKLIPAIIAFSVLISLNLLSAWHLSRRFFREFAVQFVLEQKKERHSRLMQKAAQKKIRDEIRRMRS